MAKHPCPVCGKNVSSPGILCTGPCDKWNHFKCANLTLADVKNIERTDCVGQWKCSKCNMDEEEMEHSTIDKTGDREEDLNCSSLAEEINRSILHQNEELRQELHGVKNKSSLYVLELEDKIKQFEESLEAIKNLSDERENELLSQIKSLEGKLKNQKEANESFILQVEEETKKHTLVKSTLPTMWGGCVIYKQETTKMLDTIRTLESIVKILDKEVLDHQKVVNQSKELKFTCLKCFPPLHENSNKQVLSDAYKWKKAPASSHNKNKKGNGVIQEDIGLDFTSQNPFEVLQNESLDDKLSESECVIIPSEDSTPKKSHNRRRSSKAISTQYKESQKRIYNIGNEKKKLLVCADSHGRDLCFHLNKHSKSFDCIGFVRPGGLTDQILNFHNIDGEDLGPDDVLVIACGSNDVTRNEAKGSLNLVRETLEKYNSCKIVLLDLPVRYDLKEWSCVNGKIQRFNESLEDLSHDFPNVSVIKASVADRHFHTRHGMNFNETGKNWLAEQIFQALARGTSSEPSITPGAQHTEGRPMQSSSKEEKQISITDVDVPHNETDFNTSIDSCDTDTIIPSYSEQLAVRKKGKTPVRNDTPSHPAPPP